MERVIPFTIHLSYIDFHAISLPYFFNHAFDSQPEQSVDHDAPASWSSVAVHETTVQSLGSGAIQYRAAPSARQSGLVTIQQHRHGVAALEP